jgi:hypothetical protein
MTDNEINQLNTRINAEILALEKCSGFCVSFEDKARLYLLIHKKMFQVSYNESIIYTRDNDELKSILKEMYDEIVRDCDYLISCICGRERIKASEGIIKILILLLDDVKEGIKAIHYYKKTDQLEFIV